MSDASGGTYKGPAEIDAELAMAYSERKALRNSTLALLVILLVLLGTLYALVRASVAEFPRHRVVFTTSAAAVCDLTPVTERGTLTAALVENFAAEIAVEIHALDYLNYRTEISRVIDVNFTPEARADTTRAMLESGILRTVTSEGFVLKALPDDRPAILREGVEVRTVEGLPEPTYTWIVRVPVILAYTYRGEGNAPTYRPERRNVYLTIIRTQPTAASPLGLAVAKMVSLQPSDTLDLSVMSPGASLADATDTPGTN